MTITPIPGFNPGPYTGAGNTTYLIGGRTPTLIDAGTGSVHHIDALSEALHGAELARVLVTHGHSDHASGCRALASRWPGVEFAKIPWPERDGRFGIEWQAVSDGQHVEAGDGELRVVHTPGHAPDHACFYDEGSRTMFSGDLVIEGSTVVVPATSGGCLTSYLKSLELIRDLGPARVLPAHGPEIRDLSKLVEHYLRHRRRREVEILDALDADVRTPDAIVRRVYGDLPQPLRDAAAESVLAHLAKLDREGRVRHENDAWLPCST